MRRFAQGLVSSLVAVTALGGLVVATAGPTTRDVAAESSALSQTEEDGAGETTEASAADQPAETLTPVEAFLASVLPSAEGQSLPSAQRVVLGRDPFEPVIPDPEAGGGDGNGDTGDGTDGGGTDDGGDGTGTDGDGTDGGDGDGDGDGTNGGTDACSGDENETVCEGIVVTLDGFDDDGNAIVTVDGARHIVGVDDEFAESFRVLAIDEPCATLLFGDEAFTICTGATVLK